MADVSITAGNVLLVSGSTEDVTAGGTVTAGMPVYRDSADGNQAKASRANAATTDDAYGIALNNASDGQPLKVALPGAVINMGGTLVLGEPYFVSAGAAGGVAPVNDLVATNYVTFLGVAITTANLKFNPVRGAVQLAADIT